MAAAMLNVGWSPSASQGAASAKECNPVSLDPEGMFAHSAIVAQSGSGKSFLLGRILETLLIETAARVVLFDPNSDFVKFSEVDESTWNDERRSRWLAETDTLENFRNKWREVEVALLTQRTHSQMNLNHPTVTQTRIALPWGGLDHWQIVRTLGFSELDEPDHVLEIRRLLKKGNESTSDEITLKEFMSRITTRKGWNRLTQISSLVGVEQGNNAVLDAIVVRCSRLADFGIWPETAISKEQYLPGILGKIHESNCCFST